MILKVIVLHSDNGYSWKNKTGYKIISVEYLESCGQLSVSSHRLNHYLTLIEESQSLEGVLQKYEYIIDIEEFKKSYESGHSFYDLIDVSKDWYREKRLDDLLK